MGNSIRWFLCLAVVGLGAVSRAQVGDSFAVQSPELTAPSRGSLAGSLSGVAFGPGDLQRGGIALPSPYFAPEERGPLLAMVFPSYSAESGISEWGMGWAAELALRRWRESGALDYQTDDLTGPFGHCKKGEDGFWYPVGLSKLVRIEEVGSGFVAYTSDGARWSFGQGASTAVFTPAGTYAWYLEGIETATGRRAALAYEVNSSGRLFLKQVDYGGVGASFGHRVTVDYAPLAKMFVDYRSGVGLALDRRVSGLSALSLDASAQSWRVRWTFVPSYQFDDVGPAFFLVKVEQTYASGEKAPAIQYDYEYPSNALGIATLQRAPKFDAVTASYGSLIVLPEWSSSLDHGADALADLELGYDNTLIRQGPSGFTFESLPPITPTARAECRMPASAWNVPRTLAAMRASSEDVQVVFVRSWGTVSDLIICDRAGEQVFETWLPDGWTLGPTTRLVDLNNDHQPDFIQVAGGRVEIIPNTSSEEGYSFAEPIVDWLDVGFDLSGIWLQDFNGDSLPDIVSLGGSNVVVYFNLGGFKFDRAFHLYPLLDFDGSYINPEDLQVVWIDADNDGMVDLVLSSSVQAFVLRNAGDSFVRISVGGESSVFCDRAIPLFLDLNGSGNAEVHFLVNGVGHSLALNGPGTGLLKSADDGKGTRLTFMWERAAPGRGLRSRHPVLKSVLSESAGQDPLTTTYGYDGPVVHSSGKYLVGFGQVTATTSTGSETVSFLNGDYFSGLVASSRTHDVNAPQVDDIEERTYEDVALPLPWKRLKSVVVGVQSSDGTQVAAERTEYLSYEAHVCPRRIEHVGASGILETVNARASIPGFARALHCLPARVDTSGRHDDSSFNFDHAGVIDRNWAGQVTQVQSLSGVDALTLQTVTYDADYDIKTVSSPGMGTTTFVYEPSAKLLAEVDSPDGVVTKVTEREALTDRPRTIQVDRGGALYQQFFRYDGLERLTKRWDNLGNATEANPNEVLSYRYAAGNAPATVHSSMLVDASAGGIRNHAIEYLTASGDPIVSATAIPDGWAFGPITERIRATRDVNTHLRPSLTAPVDPLSLDYAALLMEKTSIGQVRSTMGGKDASRTTVLHAGVEQKLVTTRAVGGGQVLERTVENGALATHQTLDAHQRVVAYEDEAGVTYRFTYDALGRVRRVDLPDGRRHTQTFDEHGRVARVTRDDIASVQSEYDATTGLLTRKTYFSADGAGQRKVEFAYDSIGRKKLETYADLTTSQTKLYQYYYDGATPTALTARDDLGQLSAVTGEGYSKVFTHHPDGLLASRTTAVAGFPAIRLELTYYEDRSPHTQRITQLDESGNALLSSERVLGVDGFGRVKDVSLNGSVLVTMKYDGKTGLLKGGNFANGDSLTFTHDQTTRRLIGSTQTFASYAISTLQEMNSRGLAKSETTTIGGTTLERIFNYSAQRFLESAVDAQSSYSYGFSGFGLPTFVTANGATRAIAESGTSLTAGQVTYEFDALHRTVSRTDASAPAQALKLTYGPDGQMATATKGGVTYQFRYDEGGQRLAKLTGSTPTAAYLHEGYLDSAGLTERFALGGRTVGITKNGTYTSIATDLRGSVLAEVSGAARIPSPFGERDVHPEMAAAIDYVEKGYDADLGWIRLGVRDYDSKINRFSTPDPLYLESPSQCLVSPHECNLFAYALGCPTTLVDPSGQGALHFLRFLSSPTRNPVQAQLATEARGALEAEAKGLAVVTAAGVALPFVAAGAAEAGIAAATAVWFRALANAVAVPLIVPGQTVWQTGKDVLVSGLRTGLGVNASRISQTILEPIAASVENKLIPDLQDARARLSAVLAGRVRQLAGFGERGVPVILDENIAGRGVAEALRARGFNVRDVYEIFGRGGVADKDITTLAESIGGRVLTQNARDFPAAVRIAVDARVRTHVDSLARILSGGL
jgi:RHS repeat-associated protein